MITSGLLCLPEANDGINISDFLQFVKRLSSSVVSTRGQHSSNVMQALSSIQPFSQCFQQLSPANTASTAFPCRQLHLHVVAKKVLSASRIRRVSMYRRCTAHLLTSYIGPRRWAYRNQACCLSCRHHVVAASVPDCLHWGHPLICVLFLGEEHLSEISVPFRFFGQLRSLSVSKIGAAP